MKDYRFASVSVLGAGMRLDRFMTVCFGISAFRFLQKAIRKGDVRIGGKKVCASTRLQHKDCIRIYAPLLIEKSKEKVVTDPNILLAKKLPSFILEETKNYVVFNKPANLAVQGGTSIRQSLDKAARLAWSPGLHLVHRLDRRTSGLIVMAKHLFEVRLWMERFQRHQVEKIYIALLKGRLLPEKGRVMSWIGKSINGSVEKHRNYQLETVGAKKAETIFEVLDRAHDSALVQFRPITGRTHQLRVHSASLNAPILGDALYGSTEKTKNIFLHSYRLEWVEDGLPKTITAPLPAYFNNEMIKKGLVFPKNGQ